MIWDYTGSSRKNLRSSGIATSTIICICGNMWQYSNYDTYCYWVCGHVGPSHNGGLLQRFFFSFGNLPGQVPIYRFPSPFLVIHPPGTATINNKRAAVTCNTSTSPSIQHASMIQFFDSVQWISMVDSLVLYLIGVIPWLLRLVFVFIIDLLVFLSRAPHFFPRWPWHFNYLPSGMATTQDKLLNVTWNHLKVQPIKTIPPTQHCL